ncbi:hypothetical protein [Pseudomonas tohonis]|uniref:hypothetical protein n=1 Tax=Pseudomonas tohonis TaxID=2725477 RepID=UPI001F2705E5|nr:hypothetical protein [Pseudomonas tohonis]
MPTEKGWTIRAGDGFGTLVHEDGRRISFGTANSYKSQANRIDMRKMSHGMFDTADKCVPCFIAAADLLHDELQTTRSATVHCQNGNSRTSFALIVFLARYEGFTIDEAGNFVSAGQQERTDIKFSLTKQSNNNSYWDWIRESKWVGIIGTTQNKASYRATFVTSRPSDSGNKILHVVSTNTPQQVPFVQPVPVPVPVPITPTIVNVQPTQPVQNHHWMPIRESEVRDLRREARNFLGDDWKHGY